jgi:hypothetical protein
MVTETDVILDKFEIVSFCTSGIYTHKWITELYNNDCIAFFSPTIYIETFQGK